MIGLKASSGEPPEDVVPISWAPWLTARWLTFFVIAWLGAFALGSVLISNPFQAEPATGVTPDYFHVMYMHGLLIGMVGLIALLILQVFKVESIHVRLWIVGGVLVATILSAIGGIFDTKVPGAEVPMWTQVLGFFALDEILIVLAWGLFAEWRKGSAVTRSLTYAAAAVASISMLFAAVMGHVAGWIMEFGEYPPLITDFRKFAGFATQDGFVKALVGSHSHEMAVAAIGATALIAIQFLGYSTVTGVSKLFARIGVAMIGAGIVIVSAIYVAGTVSQYAPLTVFDGRIPGDDVVSGLLVMGGGIVGLLAVVDLRTVLQRPLRLVTVWSFVLATATVAAVGYSIELHESFFGAGDPTAAGAANDAVFTWYHQDIGLFLLPSIVLVMLVVQLLIGQKDTGWIGWFATAGTTLLFGGGIVWVFFNPDLRGPGYVLSTLGLLTVGTAILGTLYHGVLGHRALPVTPTAPKLRGTTA